MAISLILLNPLNISLFFAKPAFSSLSSINSSIAGKSKNEIFILSSSLLMPLKILLILSTYLFSIIAVVLLFNIIYELLRYILINSNIVKFLSPISICAEPSRKSMPEDKSTLSLGFIFIMLCFFRFSTPNTGYLAISSKISFFKNSSETSELIIKVFSSKNHFIIFLSFLP